MALPLWAAAMLGGAYASPQDIEHLVQPGDTLEALSVHYLDSARMWPRLQAYNHVANPRRLRPGSVLRIPSLLLPAGSAEVDFVQGQANTTALTGSSAAPLQAGQALREGASIQVAPDSFVTVRLADGTLIRVQADTDLQLQQLRRRGRAGDAQSVLELRRGSVESAVPPSRDGARRFQVRTPKATTSVRGTRFVVALGADERLLAAVTEGSLAVVPRHSGSSNAATLLDAGQGVVVAADGQMGISRTLLPAPELSGLPDSLHDADFLNLTLMPVAAAVAYQVQVARDADFIQTVRSGIFGTPQVRLPALDDGSYHLQVRALDEVGLPGRVAQRSITIKAHPVAPLYQAPVPGGTVSRTRGELLCTPVAGVARYRIQVAADAGFAAPLIDETHAQQCTARVAQLAPGSYYWRAASVRELPGGASDQGPYAPGQAFTVANNPGAPSAADLQSNGDGAALQLRWPGEPGQSFRLQLAATEDFAAPLVDERLSEPTWTAAGLAPAAYFVRIQTRDPSGLESDFSTPRLLRVRAAVQTQSGEPVTSSDGQPLSRP